MTYEDVMAKLNPKLAKQFKAAKDVESIVYPLASKSLTRALGGGIGAGKIAVIYGNYSSGKSMLALQSVGMLQKQGLVCAWADVEGTFDPVFADKLGVNTAELIVTGSKSAEMLGNQLSALINAEVDLIVVDSISAIMPANFIETDGTLKGAEKRIQIGAHAKAIKSVIDSVLFNNTKTAIILISQLTTKMTTYGASQVPHGGNSTEFASSQMIRLTSSGTQDSSIKVSEMIGNKMVQKSIGRPVNALVQKNKIGPEKRTAEYDIYYDGDFIGVDTLAETVDMAIQLDIIKKSASWFTLDGEQIQGRAKLVERLREDEELMKLIEKRVDDYFGIDKQK